jgi:hypothetical protein
MGFGQLGRLTLGEMGGGGGGLPAPPSGYAYWVDDDGAYFVDDDGAFILLEV